MIFDQATKKRLRGRAHALKPIVIVGQQGYTAAVAAAVDEALADHELIKIRLRGFDRDARRDLATEICRDLDAVFIALVGSVLTVYRAAAEDAAVRTKGKVHAG